MPDDTLFTNDDPEGGKPAEPSSYDDLVGEGKKYRDNDALVQAVLEKDRFIDQLKGEGAELRSDLSTRMTVEEMLEKMNKKPDPAPTPQSDPQGERGKNPAETGKEDGPDLSEEVRRLLTEERNKETRSANLEKARSDLKQRFGADYNETLKSIASELEVSPEFLTNLAGTSPAGFSKLISSVRPADDNRSTTPPDSVVDPQKGQTAQGNRKNAAYYSNLRRTDPKLYYSKKIQNEMYKEAAAQGANFYN